MVTNVEGNKKENFFGLLLKTEAQRFFLSCISGANFSSRYQIATMKRAVTRMIIFVNANGFVFPLES